MPSFNGINFPKVITVLAITFGVSLGLCGLTAIASRVSQLAPALIPLGFLELGGILFSAVGLVVMTVLWVVATALDRTGPSGDGPQRLFDSDEKKKDGLE